MAPRVLCMEIGGTKLQAGVGSPGAPLLHTARTIVEPARGAARIREQLVELADTALAAAGWALADIDRVAIGFGGPLDIARGVALQSFQVSGWEEFPLRDWAVRQWGKPVRLQNDASTAGLAESQCGRGRGCRRVFYVTIGSGVGGGWIVDGVPDDGQGLGAAELGHMWVPDPDGAGVQELEQVASGWALGRRARTAAGQTPTRMTTLAESPAAIDARIVYAAAEQGDALARHLLHTTCVTLGLALANVVVLLHPERLIVGGGVSLMGPLFWDDLRAQIQARLLPVFAPRTEVVPAELGEEVVLIGGLYL